MCRFNLFNHKYDLVEGLRGAGYISDVKVLDAETSKVLRIDPPTFYKYPTKRGRKALAPH